MNDMLNKLNHLLLENNKNEIQKLKKQCQEQNIDFQKILKKAKEYLKELTKQAQEIGYDLDFESFFNMLEKYIEEKENYDDETKKKYLNVLLKLSTIYDINLREELEKYVSYHKSTSKDYIAQQLCLYYLEDESLSLSYEEIKKNASSNELDFDILEDKIKKYLEKLKTTLSNLGYDLEKETFFKILNDYLDRKQILENDVKINYLTILLNLSKIYNINLREKLVQNNEIVNMEYTNPIDNEQLLKTLLFQRYNNGSFTLSEITIPNAQTAEYKEEFDYINSQIELAYRIMCIYIDKLTNYATDDLNPKYTKLLDEEDIIFIKNINIEDLREYILSIKKHQELNISKNVIEFIKVLILSTEYTDIIGMNENNLFNPNSSSRDYSIFINTPSNENTFSLLNEYIIECISNNLNYEMLGFSYEETSQTRTILYSSKEELNIKLKILDNLKEKTTSFGTPLLIASTINDSYYSIAYNPNEELEYLEYLTNLLEVAYYRVLSKIIINQIIDENELNIISNFIELKNVTITEDKNSINYQYDNNDFRQIKDIVHKNIPNVLNTINMYIEEEKYTKELIKEFKKSIQYLCNITFSKNKKSITNIANPE